MKHRHTYLDVAQSIALKVKEKSGQWPWETGSLVEREVTDLIERAFIQLTEDDEQGEVGRLKGKPSAASHITLFFCRHGIHSWNYTRLESDRAVYHVRKCGFCKSEQILHCGPSGDGKFHPLGNWRNDWEREDFLNAK